MCCDILVISVNKLENSKKSITFLLIYISLKLENSKLSIAECSDITQAYPKFSPIRVVEQNYFLYFKFLSI